MRCVKEYHITFSMGTSFTLTNGPNERRELTMVCMGGYDDFYGIIHKNMR